MAEIAATVDRPDVDALVNAMHERLKDLGLSVLAASKLGRLSRSTLATLGKDGKGPTQTTLAKLDEILNWKPGSAQGVMWGKEPVPRESASPPPVLYDRDAQQRLAREIERRLRELNMSKSRFATIGGPGRTTIATLGKRGVTPAVDTLEKIDRFLMWESGSAEAVLRGGFPVRRGADTPHPSIVPLNAALDRQRRLLAQLERMEQSIAQMKIEVTESINHVSVAIADIGSVRQHDMVPELPLAVVNGTPGAEHDEGRPAHA